MSIKHRKSGDPNHVFHSGSISVYKCVECGREEAVYGDSMNLRVHQPGACPDCELKGKIRRMRKHTLIQENKVDEIRNRVIDDKDEEPYKPAPLSDAWDEGIIERNVSVTIPSLSGRSMKVRAKWSKKVWEDNVVEIELGGEKGMFHLGDIGKGLKECI